MNEKPCPECEFMRAAFNYGTCQACFRRLMDSCYEILLKNLKKQDERQPDSANDIK